MYSATFFYNTDWNKFQTWPSHKHSLNKNIFHIIIITKTMNIIAMNCFLKVEKVVEVGASCTADLESFFVMSSSFSIILWNNNVLIDIVPHSGRFNQRTGFILRIWNIGFYETLVWSYRCISTWAAYNANVFSFSKK